MLGATAAIIHPASATSAVQSLRPPLTPPLPSPNASFVVPLCKPPISVPKPPSALQPLSSKPSQKHEFSHLLDLAVRDSDIQLAGAVHATIIKIQEQTRLFNALIVSYLKLGEVNYAYKVFKSLSSPDVVSYSSLISGFAKLNREYEAVELFLEMRNAGIESNEYSFVALLTACMRILDFELGFQVHALLIKTGTLDCNHVANALIGLYGKSGYLDLVTELFDSMHTRDIISWNTVISCVVRDGLYERAFGLFQDILRIDGYRADNFTLSSLLAACIGCFATREGREIHAHAIRIGYSTNLSVNNALIGFYSKCGSMKDVMTLFERMPVKDAFTWTEMITAYMGFGLADLAVEVFEMMPEKSPVSYNAVLAGFCKNGEGLRALMLFCKMVEEGVEITDSTLTSVVKACSLMMDGKISEQIHGFILKINFGSNNIIEAALLDMCAKCGRMDHAEKIFHRWPSNQSHSILLTSLLCGYARNSQPEKAVSFFCLMQSEWCNIMDELVITALLGVCGTLGFLSFGKQIHCHALKHGFLSDIGVGNAMISMYSKSGTLEDAVKVFNLMFVRDIVSWNSLLSSYLLHRCGDDVLAIWEKMKKVEVLPDDVTCASVISAYRHTSSNLVDQCRDFFLSMKCIYNIEPTSVHYACFVAVLGYWGLLQEAEELISQMPFKPDTSVWRALLDGSRVHRSLTTGKRAVKNILSLKPDNPSAYILQSNIYAASGRWHCAELVREEMREGGCQKFPARSWIIHQNKVHSFFARDKSHPQSKDIYGGLEVLLMECLKAGYVPDTSFVLHDVEEHQRKNFLFYHSGKLAVTFGLLMARPGKPVRIMKNILLCGDCHTFFNYVSIVTKKEIHVRDASGFHYFSNGECSCKDYWF